MLRFAAGPGVVVAFAVVVGIIAAVVAPSVALAATFVVDATNDFPDETPGDGVCRGRLIFAGTNRCSLRAAIQEANALLGADSIVLEAKTYQLAQNPLTPTFPGPPAITSDITITGAGQTSTTIVAGSTDGFAPAGWSVNGGTARLIGLTVSGGRGLRVDSLSTLFLTSAGLDSGNGPGLDNLGAATVSNSTITGMKRAGGVSNAGTMTIDTTSITGNRLEPVGRFAAGIENSETGSLVLTNSLVANNTTEVSGGVTGGIRNTGSLFIANTTISGNSTAFPGAQAAGVNFDLGFLTLLNVTIANNTGVGLLVRFGGAFVIFQNTILANNTGGNCLGTIALNPDPQQQQNLDSGATCGFPAASNLNNVDPTLGTLASNGGPTQTHALPSTSPAIDAANCAVTTDQRGVARPLDGNGDGVRRCDIGAFERTRPFFVPPVGTAGLAPRDAGVGVGQTATQTVTWDVPSPEIWTALRSIDYRLRGPKGVVFWLRWDQTTNLFQLLDTSGQPVGPPFPGGTPYSLTANGVALDLVGTEGKGSGRSGQRATLMLPLSFGPELAGQTLAVELAAASDFDGESGFAPSGTIAVGVVAPASANAGDDGGRVKTEKDDPARLTEEDRRHREHTNQGGRDQYSAEGNVVAVACEAHTPSVTIANRDGLMEVVLLKSAVAACGSIRVGDYLEADGEKQTEQRFEADGISVKRAR